MEVGTRRVVSTRVPLIHRPPILGHLYFEIQHSDLLIKMILTMLTV